MDAVKFAEMLAVFEELVRVVSDLTALSKKKSQVLVAGGLADLDVLLKGEQALIWQMGRLEERRFKLQVECAQLVGIHPSELTLERLSAALEPNEAPRWQAVAAGLNESVAELAQVNELNSALVSQAMAYVDFSLQALGAGTGAARQIYSERGSRGASDPRSPRFDNRM